MNKKIEYLKVKVTPGAGKESVEKTAEDSYIVSVKEKAKNNLANRRVLELLAEDLKVVPKRLEIINGHHHTSKLIRVL